MAKVKPSNKIFDVDWIHLIDSGGQPQFLDILPLLFRTESLHIVVTRLDQSLIINQKLFSTEMEKMCIHFQIVWYLIMDS